MQHELESFRNYSGFICDDRELERLQASFDTICDGVRKRAALIT
jgi:hypothetical protein